MAEEKLSGTFGKVAKPVLKFAAISMTVGALIAYSGGAVGWDLAAQAASTPLDIADGAFELGTDTFDWAMNGGGTSLFNSPELVTDFV